MSIGAISGHARAVVSASSSPVSMERQCKAASTCGGCADLLMASKCGSSSGHRSGQSCFATAAVAMHCKWRLVSCQAHSLVRRGGMRTHNGDADGTRLNGKAMHERRANGRLFIIRHDGGAIGGQPQLSHKLLQNHGSQVTRAAARVKAAERVIDVEAPGVRCGGGGDICRSALPSASSSVILTSACAQPAGEGAAQQGMSAKGAARRARKGMPGTRAKSRRVASAAARWASSATCVCNSTRFKAAASIAA